MNSATLIGRLTADPRTHTGDKNESATFEPDRDQRVLAGAPVADAVQLLDRPQAHGEPTVELPKNRQQAGPSDRRRCLPAQGQFS